MVITPTSPPPSQASYAAALHVFILNSWIRGKRNINSYIFYIKTEREKKN